MPHPLLPSNSTQIGDLNVKTKMYKLRKKIHKCLYNLSVGRFFLIMTQYAGVIKEKNGEIWIHFCTAEPIHKVKEKHQNKKEIYTTTSQIRALKNQERTQKTQQRKGQKWRTSTLQKTLLEWEDKSRTGRKCLQITLLIKDLYQEYTVSSQNSLPSKQTTQF